MKYMVEIEQTRTVHRGEDSEYVRTDTLQIPVKNIEEIETIIGLFGDFCTITIIKEKED